MILDSGTRKEFETGAVRDITEGKGRCDLLPLDVIGETFHDPVLSAVEDFIRDGTTKSLEYAIKLFISKRWNGDVWTAILELSIHYEEGAKKYAERNWENGMPIHCYINSGVRHYLKFLRGDKDERHDRAFLWNMFGALWTLKRFPELNDLPCVSLSSRENDKEEEG